MKTGPQGDDTRAGRGLVEIDVPDNLAGVGLVGKATEGIDIFVHGAAIR
jgi:hypothetical protein